MKRSALALLLLALAAPFAAALDKHDYAAPGWGTAAGFEADGDGFSTYSVSCSSTAATQVRPAVVDRSRRRLRVQNVSTAYKVNLGSSTVTASDVWTIGESTNAATVPIFETYNSGQLYCVIANAPASGALAAATLQVMEEDDLSDQTGNP